MFHQARNFDIHNSQFIMNSSGPQASQGPLITYQDIKLATPGAPTFFAGREKITQEAVEKLLQDEPAHLAILGAGGMGKTALALHIIKNPDVKTKFQDKIFFVPCEICSDATSLIHTVVQSLRLQIPEGKTGFEVLEVYLTLCQWPILIVLDNFETPWNGTGSQSDVINLIDHLLDYSRVFIILTMRAANGPGNRQWVKLGGNAGLPQLKLSEARQMFLSFVQFAREDSQILDWILGELDGMPLAVVLIAQLERQLNLGLEQLVNLWKKHKTALLKNGMQNETRLTSVNVSINMSLQMARKQISECKKVLAVLSYLPNGLPAWHQHVNELFAKNLDPSFIPVIAVKQLLDFALVHQEGNNLKFVLPIQEYIQREYPAEKQHLDQIGAFYVKFLKHFGPEGSNSQNIIEQHLENIVKILVSQLTTIERGGDFLEACTAIMAYEKFYPITMSLIDIVVQNQDLQNGERIDWMLRKVKAYHWMGKNVEAKAGILKMQVSLEDMATYIMPINLRLTYKLRGWQELAVILCVEGGYSEARTLLFDTKDAFERIRDQRGAAECLERLGHICMVEGSYSEARTMLSDAKGTFEHIGDQLGVAECLRSLGNICRMEHNYSEARTMLSDAKTTFEHIGNLLGAAKCLQSLGDVLQMENKYSEARIMLSDAKTTFEHIGGQLGAAQCLQSLGDICRMEHNYFEARRMYSDAKATFEHIGNLLGAAQCLQGLGDILKMESKYSEARIMLSDAKTTFEHIGNPLGAAQCLQSLGDILQMENKYSEARIMLSDAKTTFDHIGNPLGAAQSLQSLGDILQMENKYSGARTMLSDAKATFEHIGSQLGAAQCLRSLGDICRMEHNNSEARTMLSDAKATFEHIGNPLGAAQCLQSLGDICRMEHNYSEAKIMLSDAKTTFEHIGGQLGAAQCLQNLGDICRIEHNYSEARTMLSDAKTTFEHIGSQLGAAQCLRSLGDICRMEHNYSEARTMVSDAKATFEHIGGQLGAAQCLQSLGDICIMEDNYSEARTMVSDAKATFEHIGNQLGAAQCLQALGIIEQMENHPLKTDSSMLKNAKNSFKSLIHKIPRRSKEA
ncbi:hypothetical protein D9757_014763 [Collybiopsis confluens]|uniref:NB-ARC domain-containing protein n=1 Tax=Collybiopsis confluens TaxID=2823264 RepID=A0A8H5D8J8_9AGAR|nr:hypothetical protein D9757_014763 [Collybiopsis confluens]